ncbi:MAG: PKD domain-containing protein [Bacteroidia bacterium]|nr:PKD domain-containing protein [Bacteroidia bacterium]
MRLIRLTLFILFIRAFTGFAQTESCRKSTEGTDFWFGFMEGRNYNSGHYDEITLTSSYACNYKYYIGKSTTPVSGTLSPNTPVKIQIDWHLIEATGSETTQDRAIHLTSDNPLNVYALNWSPNSSEVALIYPTKSLGNEYYAMCYTPHINGNNITSGNGRNSEFMIVASENLTTVTITPSKVTDQNRPAKTLFQITLNQGEVYQVQSDNLLVPKWPGQGDLTGSYIKSDKPIAVYSGSLSTTIPADATVSAWDHLYEQMPPMQTWGRKFITVPLKTRHEDTYRILAAEDYTVVRIGSKTPVTLMKGIYYEFSLLYTEPSLIESDKPILLAQFSNSNTVDATFTGGDGDPFMVIVSPVNQTREKVAFVAYDSPQVKSKFYINVVVKDDAVGAIKLDNVVVSFTALSGSGYSYAQVPLVKGNHYIESTVAGKGFIAYVYGFGGVEAYGYGVGYNLDIVLDLGSNINANGEKLVVRCDGDPPLTLNAGNAFDNYLWNTGETTSTIQVTNAGWYKVKASITDGCSLQDSVELQISKPSVFLGRDTTICNPANIILDASDQFANYLWSTTQTSQKISISNPGTYTVDATNKYGCKAKDDIKIDFTDKPKINLSRIDTLMCGKYTTTVDISADKTVNWLLGSSNPKVNISNLTATVLPADEGTYPFILTAKDEFSCASTAAFKLGFYHSPIVNLGSDSTICNPENIKLNAGDGFADYLWSTTETTPAITVKKDGLYSVNIIDKSGCKTSDEMKVSFTNRPKIDLSKLETLICGKFATTLNVSADKKVNWFEDSDPKVKFNGLSATVLPADFGTYPVTLTAKDTFSCKSDTTFKLGFYKIPKVDFNIEAKKCSGYNLLARYVGDADTIVSNFKWVFRGDVFANEIGLNSLIVPLGVNRPRRDLELTVMQDGCSDSISQNVVVTPLLFLPNDVKLGCEPFKADFSATNTEEVDYSWDFGDGSAIENSDSITSHTYQKANFYDVKLKVVTKDGCSNEVKIDSLVHVAPIPTAGFTPLPAECLLKGNHEISYIGSGDKLDTYKWDLSKFDKEEIIQNPDTTQGPFIFYLKNKPQANIRLSVISKYGCKSDTAKVLVKRIPDFSISASSYAGCTPFGPLFTATTGDPVDQVNYSWNFGDSATGPGKQIKHVYGVPDHKYDVVLSALSTTTGCADTISKKEYMWTYPIPTAGFTALPVECLDKGNHEISYLGTGDKLDTYLWDLSKLDKEEVIQNPDTTQGPLIFKLKNKPQANIGLRVISKYGCRSDTASVLVKRIPDFSVIASSNAGCTPFDPLFTGKTSDPVDQVNYSWDFGDGTKGSGEKVKHVYPEPDHKYNIILYALSSTTGCTDTLFNKEFVFAYPKPIAGFSMDNKVVYNDKPIVNFLNKSSGEKEYLWDFGDGLTSELKSPSHYYKVLGYRTVLLEVFNEFQCSDTVSHQLLVAMDRIFPPNAFSPNAPNGIDREFRLSSVGIATEGYHLTIFSRWNDIVFETRDAMKGWNGQMPNGLFVPAGTYVWIFNFSDFLGRRHRQTGTVTVVY